MRAITLVLLTLLGSTAYAGIFDDLDLTIKNETVTVSGNFRLTNECDPRLPDFELKDQTWQEMARITTCIRDQGIYFNGYDMFPKYTTHVCGAVAVNDGAYEWFDAGPDHYRNVGRSQKCINSIDWREAARIGHDLCSKHGYVGGWMNGHHGPRQGDGAWATGTDCIKAGAAEIIVSPLYDHSTVESVSDWTEGARIGHYACERAGYCGGRYIGYGSGGKAKFLCIKKGYADCGDVAGAFVCNTCWFTGKSRAPDGTCTVM